MTLGEFYELLRSAHARGPLLEWQMVRYTQQAQKWLERNQDFKYMQGRIYFLGPIDSNYYTLLRTKIKKIEEVGFVGSDQGIIPLRGISRRDFGGSGRGQSRAWWYESGRIYFDYFFDKVYLLGADAVFYTTWPTDEDDTHPLLEDYSDVILYQTLMGIASHLRNQQSYLEYKSQRDEALRTAWIAEESSEPAWMSYYGGTYGLYLPSSAGVLPVLGIYNIPDIYGVPDLYAVGA